MRGGRTGGGRVAAAQRFDALLTGGTRHLPVDLGGGRRPSPDAPPAGQANAPPGPNAVVVKRSPMRV